MENAERVEDEHRAPAATAPRQRVPADWFVDPADPRAADRLQPSGSRRNLATAFLIALDGQDAEDHAASGRVATEPSGGATVTALHPGVEAPQEAGPPQEPVGSAAEIWSGLPALADPLEVGGELAWQVEALCAQTDPEAFFPEKGGSTRDAKKVCSACPVRAECLEYALSNDERFGIWGGLSERERRRLRKRSV